MAGTYPWGMKRIEVALLPTLALLAAAPARADIVWVGGVSTDIFDEANWDLSGSTVTVIDPGVTIQDNVVIVDAPAPIDVFVPGTQDRFEVGNAYTMRIENSVVFTSDNDGVGGEGGTGFGGGPAIVLTDCADLSTFFIVNGSRLSIDHTSSAHLAGAANPINGSTIDLTLGSMLACPNEVPADFINEHLSKITVDGAQAVVDGNLSVDSDGATGSVARRLAPGTNYCVANPNSTGCPARISLGGSGSLASPIDLLAAPVPNQVGVFFYGLNQVDLPFGNGRLCTAGSLVRLGFVTANGGAATMTLDLSTHGLVPGDVRNFQYWYVDSVGGGAGFNTSDAHSVTFVQ